MAKVNELVDLKVEIDPPRMYTFRRAGESQLEAEARELESWAKDLEEFVRDHRSQDPVRISVVRVHEDVCSHCGYGWEEDEEGVPVCCAKAIEEHESAQEVAP